jgi:hypothetical protein
MNSIRHFSVGRRLKRLSLSAALLTVAFAAPAGADSPQETAQQSAQRIASELEAESLLVQLHYAELDAQLEPCINGDVSASGRFASDALETAVERLATGEMNQHLEDSAYYQAFNEGRLRLPH